MNAAQILEVAVNGKFNNRIIHGKVVETHISWVILTRKYVFKIKKPLKFSFLDFSTLKQRRKNCQREIDLNTRVTNIYLAVVSLRLFKGKWIIGGKQGRIIDYAVLMKRMAIGKRMDIQLQKDNVQKKNIQALANEIAVFHYHATVVHSPFALIVARNLFNDIVSVIAPLKKWLGAETVEVINASIKWSDAFLSKHQKRFQERVREGFKRDVHGDLHSGNVFLYKYPILFDCIEFNDDYRKIDVLNEIAFVCMDIEAFGKPALAKLLISEYSSRFSCFVKTEDYLLFEYYKCLRANIRAKVHIMQAMQLQNPKKRDYHVVKVKGYLSLMKQYIDRMKKFVLKILCSQLNSKSKIIDCSRSRIQPLNQ